MDYSPSPSKIKPQYAFLDNSIEVGRGSGSVYENRYATKVESPLKPVKDTETLHERQRKFYSKYQDLGSESNSPKRPTSKNYDVTTTSRLFKTFDSKNVPIDDDVRISSNMIEKIIRENESLRQQLKEQRREKELVNGFANGLKEKLIKYKKLNDGLKLDLQNLTQQNKVLLKQKEILENLQNDNEYEDQPKYKFNPDSTRDVFNEEQVDDEKEDLNEQEKASQSIFNEVKIPKVEKRIHELEVEITKINDSQESRFDYIKNEIEFLKKLSLQLNETKEQVDNIKPREDDQVIEESEEVSQLQQQVDIFKKKLQIREENRLRKHKLKEELSKLTLQLDLEDLPHEEKSASSSHPHQQVHTPPSQTTKSPLQESNKSFELPQSFQKEHCEPCEQAKERPCVNIDGTRWYQ